MWRHRVNGWWTLVLDPSLRRDAPGNLYIDDAVYLVDLESEANSSGSLSELRKHRPSVSTSIGGKN